jgi:hypothetical protein
LDADPNILNAFILLDRSVALPFSLLITIASVSLCSIIAFYFFRSYKFSGFRYLLDYHWVLRFLGHHLCVNTFELIYYTNYSLYHLFLTVIITVRSIGFNRLVIHVKNRVGSNGKYDDATADPDLSKH